MPTKREVRIAELRERECVIAILEMAIKYGNSSPEFWRECHKILTAFMTRTDMIELPETNQPD